MTNGTCQFNFEDLNKTVRAAYTFCGIFSLIFLIITMFVYFSLPTLKNLPGKIVLSNVTSILLTTKLLIIIYNVQVNFFQNSVASTNPRYDKRLFIHLPVQYMKTTRSQHVVYINCLECQNKNKKTIYVHNMF